MKRFRARIAARAAARQSASGGAAPVPVPLSISGCQLLLDAADSTTITGTTSITAWRDKSGNNNDSIFTGTNPSYVAASNAVITANLNQRFTVPAATLRQTTGSGSIFMVYGDQQTQGGAYAALFSSGSGNLYQALTRPDAFSYIFNQTNLAAVTNALNTTNTLLYNMNYTYNSTTGSIRINGTTRATSYDVIANPSGSLTLSATSWGDTGNVRLYEVITYVNASPLTTSEIQKVEGYLAWKWGLQASLPGDHLYKSAAPT